ncbi:NADH dehydrogenase [ubiquinone] 1 beta subcomplex subunit 1 [Eurosta solidaginis]|uniref:NADH dehydrogenase [ubiquinone] 1 beta subcomplex subunit 1 n=1 Tax=Eurosta solidaginis TaxID=178769 RepID=UPI003530B2E1
MFAFEKRYLVCVLPFIGFAIGAFLDRKETERMVLFRDKSALYARPDGSMPKTPSW